MAHLMTCCMCILLSNFRYSEILEYCLEARLDCFNLFFICNFTSYSMYSLSSEIFLKIFFIVRKNLFFLKLPKHLNNLEHLLSNHEGSLGMVVLCIYRLMQKQGAKHEF